MRALLLIAVLLIGYDAIVHQGAYTRSAWDRLTNLTNAAVDGARDVGSPTRANPQ